MEQVRGNTFQAEGTVSEQNKTEGLWSPWLWLDGILTFSVMCTFSRRGLRRVQGAFGTYHLVTGYYRVYNNNYHLTGPSWSLNWKHGLGSKRCCFTACVGSHVLRWSPGDRSSEWLEIPVVRAIWSGWASPFSQSFLNFSKLSKFCFGFFSTQENLIC